MRPSRWGKPGHASWSLAARGDGPRRAEVVAHHDVCAPEDAGPVEAGGGIDFLNLLPVELNPAARLLRCWCRDQAIGLGRCANVDLGESVDECRQRHHDSDLQGLMLGGPGASTCPDLISRGLPTSVVRSEP